MTLETSSGQAAGPSLLFDSNPSHKCLWSCQNLKREIKKQKQSLGKPPTFSFWVEEEAPESSSVPSPPSLPLSIHITTPLPQALTEIQTLIFQGRQSGFSSWWHRINLTYLQSSQWSPRLPCSSWQPDLCGQICWHLGTTCRRRFPRPSGSSFWAEAGPGWWSSVAEREGIRWEGNKQRETLFNQCSCHLFMLPKTPDAGYMWGMDAVWKCAHGWGRKTEEKGGGMCVGVWPFTPWSISVKEWQHLLQSWSMCVYVCVR